MWMARGQEEGPRAGWSPPGPGEHVTADSPPRFPPMEPCSSVIGGDGFWPGEGVVDKLGTKTAKTQMVFSRLVREVQLTFSYACSYAFLLWVNY